MKKLDVFIHRAVRRLLGIKMQQVIDDRITRKQVRESFSTYQMGQITIQLGKMLGVMMMSICHLYC
jgi:hypothetical protein